MPGVIACDIDGTLTSSTSDIPQLVIDTLEKAYLKGWSFIFITGRPFVWTAPSLKKLSFPYLLAVINGANVIQMPEQRLIEEREVSKFDLESLEAACKQRYTDFVVYSGFRGKDVCYYRPENFSASQLHFLMERSNQLGEQWIAVNSFLELPLTGFASIKCFGSQEDCQYLANHMERVLKLHAPVIRDPYAAKSYVVQGTHPECNKGKTLLRFLDQVPNRRPVIAAGDDYNDLSMLKEADLCIVMESAPQELLLLADIVAPSANQSGLAMALEEAISRFH